MTNPASHHTSASAGSDSTAFCQALLQRMTLEEKIGQMVQADLSWKEDIEGLLRAGRIGSMFTIKDMDALNNLQRIAVEGSRLGIPLLIGNDTIHGCRTIFPIPLALSCTWDTGLTARAAEAIANEAAAAGTSLIFGPMVDIARDARWGRIAEGAGEDPCLGSEIASAWVQGFQAGRAPGGRKTAACVKHFAAYGAVESGKDYNSVDMSERRLREEYLPPYLAAVRSGSKALMTAFNDLNGVPATANAFLLQTILRQEWDFDGLVISDYDSIGELILHGFAEDHREAARKSMLAGVEMDMMGNAYHYHLAELVEDGTIPLPLIDQAVMHILLLKKDLGLFEDPYIDHEHLESVLLRPEGLSLALEAAERSIVLLKNDGRLLPLRLEGKRIALIGPLAEERESLLGSWSFDGRASETETLLECLRDALPETSRLTYVRGCEIEGGDADFAEAIQAAREADIALLALGESSEMSGEAHCRAYLGLPGQQQALAEVVAAAGKPVVAVLFAGRPLVIPWLAERIPAVLMAWQGGSRCAQAVVNVLTGKYNPSAKLTTSFPRAEGQLPVYYAHKSTGRPFDSIGTLQFNQLHKSVYLDASNLPLFPFGFGLSYTSFIYGDLEVETPAIDRDGALVVSARIKNDGKFPGEEIVQCYVRDLVGSVTRPVKELKGWRKIALRPGEEARVVFHIPASQFSFLDMDLKPLVEPGDFRVWIGPNSQEGLEGKFSIRE